MRLAVPTDSSFADHENKAKWKTADERGDFKIIGLGSAGTVFEIPGTELAVKKGADEMALLNDFFLTNSVHIAFAKAKDTLQSLFPDLVVPKIPLGLNFMTAKSHEYWKANRSRFPESHRDPGAAFEVTRILPLPQAQRELLIDKYFDEDVDIREEAKNDQRNKSCLVRVYLGEREDEDQLDAAYDSLENFPLRLNMVEETLAEDRSLLAAELALALSIIHWQAQVDGMDCEYVLASSTASAPERRELPHLDPQNPVLPKLQDFNVGTFNWRPLHLWVLDFDKASMIQLTQEDVDKRLVPAFLGNDPYYPRPDVDKDLWIHFSNVYCKASIAILTKRNKSAAILELPRRFLEKVELQIEEQIRWDEENHVIFGD